jgi:hypothetical protein
MPPALRIITPPNRSPRNNKICGLLGVQITQTHLLAKRHSQRHNLGLVELCGQVYLVVPRLQVGALHNQPLVQRVALCSQAGR